MLISRLLLPALVLFPLVSISINPSIAQALQPDQAELVYTPIAPCRVFGGIAQSAGKTLNFQITGSANLGGQGGPSSGCGIPASAKAVSMNLSATSSAAGKIIGFAKGTARPNTVSLNYQPGKTETAGTILAMDGAGKASIYTSAASRTFGDVTGYYAPQMAAVIYPSGDIRQATPRVVSASKVADGNYQVFFDRNVTACYAAITAEEPYLDATRNRVDDDDVQLIRVVVWSRTQAGGSQAVNGGFQIIVHC
jgi:hypothetical protein